MWSTKEFVNDLYKKYFSTNKMAVLKVTNQCNIECEHCREASCAADTSFMSNEVIDTVLQQIDTSWIVTLQGGEPTLDLGKCKYIIDSCKEKNIVSVIYTNGWWHNMQPYYREIEKMNPEILVISINKWTSKLIDISYADKIGYHFKDSPITVIYSECHDGVPTMKDKITNTSQVIDYTISPVGRASYLQFPDINFIKKETKLCTLSGFEIETNGKIYSNCCAGTQGCFFGSIFKTDLSGLLKRQYRDCIKFNEIFKNVR
jgi:MoaA/NifB/PqqE/SkfB family radical SAM enzyme